MEELIFDLQLFDDPPEIPGGGEQGGGEGFGGDSPGGGNVPGGSSSSSVEWNGAIVYTEATVTSAQTYTSTSADENAVLISTTAEVTLNDATVTKSGGTSSSDNYSFYGINSAVMCMGGGKTTINGGTVTTDAAGANGIFSYGANNGTTNATGDGTTVYIKDVEINTTGNGSGGIMTTYGGTTVAENLTITTEGDSSAPIRTDRGGGWVTVTGGSYTSNGLGSPAIYSTADVTVNDATLISNKSEGVCIEGTGSITLTNCDLTANNTATNGNATFYDTIMIYQSQSGDASDGTSTFSMTGGTLNSKSGHVFHVTNTTAIINLDNVTINNEDSEEILLSVCDDGWSSTNSTVTNAVTLKATNQTLNGNILVGDDSTLNLNLGGSSTFTGNISGGITNASGNSVSNSVGTVNVTVDEGSTWNLTEDTYITSLTNNGTITTGSFNLYVNNEIYDGGQTSDDDQTITNSQDNASVSGTSSNDTIFNDGANSTINADNGDDSITNSAAGVVIDAGAGNDTITNNGANVKIISGEGDNYIENNGENVTIISSAGNDTVAGISETTDIIANVKASEVDGDNIILTTDDGSVTILDSKGKTFLLNGDETIYGGSMEEVTVDGVVYTPLDENALLIYDTKGNVTGVTGGKIQATLENVSESPVIVIDGTTAFNFSASAEDNALSVKLADETSDIKHYSGTANYSASNGVILDPGAVVDGTPSISVTLSNQGTYTLNGVSFTSNSSDIEVSMSTENAVVFDVNANISYGSHTISGVDGTKVQLNSNGEIWLIMYKVGTATIDRQTFTLLENVKSGVKVSLIDNGFKVSHVITVDNADKIYLEKVEIINDKDYSVVIDSNGVNAVSGISARSDITSTAYIDDVADKNGTSFEIITESAGTFNFGTNNYTVSDDNQITLQVQFDENGNGKVVGIGELIGTISGNFTSETSVNDASFEVSLGNTEDLTIVANSTNATVLGIEEGANFTSEDGIAVKMNGNNLTVNDVNYQLSNDEDGVTIAAAVISGLEENAQLVIGSAGYFTVNGTSISLSDVGTVLGITENYAYLIKSSNPLITAETTTEEILEAYGVNSDKVIPVTSSENETIPATVKGKVVTIGAGVEGEKEITFGNKGNMAIIENTTAPITIIGGTGGDTIITSGENVTFDMINGGRDKVIATGGNVTLANYDATTSKGGVKLTTEDVKSGVQFGDNKIALSNATVDAGTNVVNLYMPGDTKQIVAFTTENSKKLDFSSSKEDLILVGGGDYLTNTVGGSTLMGGKGNDTIYGGGGDFINAGTGSNLVTMSDDGGSVLNFVKGNTTVDNFNFVGENADSILTGLTIKNVSIENDDVIFQTSKGNIQISGGLNQDITFVDYDSNVSVAQIGGNDLMIDDNTGVYWASGEDASISVGDLSDTDTTLSIKLDGSKQDNTYRGNINHIDASNYSGAADLAGNSESNVIKASNGGSTLTGGASEDTLYGGDGADVFIYNSGDGKDIIKNFTFGTDENSDMINTGSVAVANIAIENEDLVLLFKDENDKLIIENAVGQNMQFVNEYTPTSDGVVAQVADTALTVDGTANLFWASGKNASISVGDLSDTDTTLSIKFDGSKQDNIYNGNINHIDASNYSGAADLAGNSESNIIKASNGGSTLTGGASKDTLYGGDGADVFIYNSGDGKDVIKNFTFGTDENSDMINTGNTVASDAKVKNGKLILSFGDGDDKLTIESADSDAAGKDFKFANDSETVVAQVNDTLLVYDDTANLYWATGKNASVIVDDLANTDTKIVIKLDGTDSNTEYRGDIKYVDTSNYNGAVDITGNYKGNVIIVGNGGSTVNGGEGKDTIYGGDGADEFVYNSGDGKDIIKNFAFATDENADKINTGDMEVTGVEIKDDDLVLLFENSSDKLTIEEAAGKNIQLVNDSSTIIAQVADNSINVDGKADLYWAAGKNATVKIVNADFYEDDAFKNSVSVNLNDNSSYRGSIKCLDASEFNGTAELTGNDRSNLIIAGSGGSTLTGGAGRDTLVGAENVSDTFVYNSGDGKDLIKGFTFGTKEDSDIINAGNNAVSSVKVDGGNVIIMFNGTDDRLTIEGAAGKNMQFVSEHTPTSDGVVAQVADTVLTYNDTANLYWATGKNATLTVDEYAEDVNIWLDESGGNSMFSGSIKVIDARKSYADKAVLFGNDKNNSIFAGNGDSSLWGGNGGNDTLIGGDGSDVFYYKNGNGKDIIQGANENDTVDLEGITLDMWNDILDNDNAKVTDDSIEINFSDGGRLSLDTNNGTTFNVDGTSWIYNKNESKWTKTE